MRLLVMAASVGAAIWGLSAAATQAKSAQVITPDEAYRAYANGDDTAAERWAVTLPPTASPYGTLAALRADAPWNRMAAAFLLEVAVANASGGRAVSALNRGRTLILKRPERLGGNPAEDRFEILWHQAALGISQRHHSISSQAAYLEAIVPRFEEAARRGVALETRFALLQAVTAGERCCGMTPLLSIDAATRYFDLAAEQPALRTEALIRGGKLLFEWGRHTDALDRFEKVPLEGDAVLNFVRHLTHARVFDALQRPADAAAAYERALDANPKAQLAAIGLAAAQLRLGNTAEAAKVADAARRMPSVPGRGFFEFDAGDHRFVSSWLAEIRSMRR
jgi:tetratricopeptide (TPR) repeat protein